MSRGASADDIASSDAIATADRPSPALAITLSAGRNAAPAALIAPASSAASRGWNVFGHNVGDKSVTTHDGPPAAAAHSDSLGDETRVAVVDPSALPCRSVSMPDGERSGTRFRASIVAGCSSVNSAGASEASRDVQLASADDARREDADASSSSSSSSSATRHHHASRRGVFMAGAGAPLLRLAAMTAGTGAASLNLTARAAAASSYGSVEDTTSEIAKVLLDPKYPDVYPFDASMMARYDESKDSAFYSQPRFVQHIDDDAIKALTGFYARTFPASGSDDVALLDVCSSWCARAASDRVPYDRVRVVDVDR
jgi:hypothetical protein